MRETDFIAKNKDKWAQYEKALKYQQQDPELLKSLYTHTTDDLSYARTFYPNRTVRVYLNSLARRTFLQLNRNRSTKVELFIGFWVDELPRILYARRRPLLVSLLVFSLAILIGIVSYKIDTSFAELILGDHYVDMTKEFIRSGDPMAVYKQRSPVDMFFQITLNNIYVALQVFVMGAFYAIGAIVILIQNGIMLGVFQYFFVEKGLFWESFLTIWIHGALEISSIVIAGGAGLTMGSGLLFPGTYTRLQAFGKAARDGLKIMLGTIPLFVIAGFLESYLTRHTEVADVLRFFFILSCFAFVFWYYWLYPRQVAARPAHIRSEGGRRERSSEDLPIATQSIKPIGELLADVFILLRRGGDFLLSRLFLLGLVVSFLLSFLGEESITQRFTFSGRSWDTMYNLHNVSSTFGFGRDLSFLLWVSLGLGAILLLTCRVADKILAQPPIPLGQGIRSLLLPLLWITLLFSLPSAWVLWLGFLTLPFLLTYAYVSYRRLGGLSLAARYVYKNVPTVYGLSLILFLLGFFTIFIVDTTVMRLVFAAVSWVFMADPQTLFVADLFLQLWLYWLFLGLLLSVCLLAMILHFYSEHERATATGLRARIGQLGKNRRLRGLEVE